MKVEVRYYTRSGNTKKLAEAIAEAVGVDDNIKKFISNIDVKIGKVVNFSTAALIKSTYKQVGKLLAKKGIVQAEEEFYCKGSFGAMHKGKPDEKDCMAAAVFAKKVIS